MIVNRASIRFRTFSWVIFEPGQFAGVSGGLPDWFTDDDEAVEKLTWADYEARKDCYVLAGAIVAGRFAPSGFWTHFYSGPAPDWAAELVETEKIGNHTFGRLPFWHYR